MIARLALGAVVAALAAGTGAGALAADRAEEGRRQLKAANQLAAAGKCKAAIPKFTASYRILRDPAVLFNRAECYRKLGDDKKALADYRRFLQQMPAAPNRATVESRIAELGGPPVPSPAPPPPTTAAVPVPVPVPDPAPAPPPPPPPPTVAEETRAPSLPSLPPEPPPRSSGAPGLSLPVLPADQGGAARLDETEPPDVSTSAPARIPVWMWIGGAALLVTAGAIGGYLLLRPERTELPASALGNVRF